VTVVTETSILEGWMADGRVVVLTGAGCSTASGIPDYRGPNGAFTRGHSPMTYQQFLRDPEGRKRYWARGHVGWERFSQAQPNAAHRALAELEHSGSIDGVITQNVDGLHEAAGSVNVIDLHGRLDRVLCLSCGQMESRVSVHERLTTANPWLTVASDSINPDGDTDIPDALLADFTMVSCLSCGGDLKPDVVYFGENVPPDRVTDAYAMVDRARTLVVAGSTLTVYSGRRFAIHANKNDIPIAIINSGPTKADDIASIRIDADVCEVLDSLTNRG
jgi:NAD-dependent SIR2 family protein deacetylase